MADSMNIKLGVDIQDVLTGMQRAGKSLNDFVNQSKRFKDALASATDPKTIERLNRAIDATNAKIKAIQSAGTGASSGLVAVSKGSNQAGTALMNLGRVAQDAPFGFIGIANNINPLLESFQRLKAETGSTSTALKALGSSLLGAGGLGLAVSVVTALLTVFSMQSRSSGDEVEKTKKKVDEAAQAQQKFAQDIRSASDAMVSQAKHFKDLKALLVDTTLNYGQLTEATKKQALAQYLFSQRSEEVKKILDSVIKQQLIAAKIKNPFAGAGVREYASDLLVYDRYLEDVKNGLVRFDKTAAEIKKNAQEAAEAQADLKNLNALSTGLDNIFDKLVSGEAKIKKSKETISGVLSDLSKEIDFLNAKSLAFGTNEIDAKIKAVQSAAEKLIKDFNVSPDDSLINKLLTGGQLQSISGFEIPGGLGLQLRKELKKTIETKPVQPTEIIVPVIPKIEVAPINNDEFKKALRAEDLNAGISEVFKSLQQTVTAGLGDMVTNAFSGKSIGNIFGNFFKTILTSLGDGIQKLGEQTLIAGTIIANLKKLFGTTAGIGASIALIALGGIIKGLANRIEVPGFADGTSHFRGGLAVVGERGPELVNLPTGSGVIPNHSLSGSIGGGAAIEVTGSIVARGSDLVVVFDRARRSLGRTG